MHAVGYAETGRTGAQGGKSKVRFVPPDIAPTSPLVPSPLTLALSLVRPKA